MTRRAAWLVLAVGITAGCVGPGSYLDRRSPHAVYAAKLERDGRAASAAGQAWRRAATVALVEAVGVTPPFRGVDLIDPEAGGAAALGYRVGVARGRRLSVAVGFDAAAPGPLFVDVFRTGAGEAPRYVASLAPGRTSLVHDVDAGGDYVIRIQAGLEAKGRATIAVRTLASLPFPVDAADGRMRSAFGVERDAGRRQHEGIDIFAPKGTDVLAVAGGIARTGTNRLGGNVVWVYAPGEGRTFYYAHLDRPAIGPMAIVQAGDVLGYVGNTGNAARTPPHLHFGIYDRGAIDPWPFVAPDQPIPATPRNRPRPRSVRRPSA